MKHILEKYSTYKVMEVFFNDPYKNFQLREISRIVNIDHKAVITHLKRLVKLGMIKEDKETLYKSYKANINEHFKNMKRAFNLVRIYESGVVDHIFDKAIPKSITLFGSYEKGTDTIKSDIDLYVDAKEQNIELTKYEKILNRKISILFKGKMSDELKENLTNGIVLKGNLRI